MNELENEGSVAFSEALGYLRLLYDYLQYRLFLILGMGVVLGLLDSLGLLTFLPVLLALLSTQDHSSMPSSGIEYVDLAITYVSANMGPSVLLVLLVMVFVIKGGAIFAIQAFLAHQKSYFLRLIKYRLYDCYFSTGLSDWNSGSIGERVNVINEQANQTLLCLTAFSQLALQLASVLIYVGLLFLLDPHITLAFLAISICIFLTFKGLNTRIRTQSREIQKGNTRLSQIIISLLSNHVYIKATRRAGIGRALAGDQIEAVAHSGYKIGAMNGFVLGIREPAILISMILVWLLANKFMEIDAIAFGVYALIAYKLMNAVLVSQKNFQTALANVASLEIVTRHLDQSLYVATPDERVDLHVKPKRIGFTKVGLREKDGKYIFKDLTFELPMTSFIFITGEDLRACRQLLYMFAGLIPPSAGKIEFDGESFATQVIFDKHLEVGFVSADVGELDYHVQLCSQGLRKAESPDIDADGLALLKSINPRLTTPSVQTDNLSLHEKQILALVIEAQKDPDILIIEDLDLKFNASAMRAVVNFLVKRKDKGLVVSLSNDDVLKAVADKAITLS